MHTNRTPGRTHRTAIPLALSLVAIAYLAVAGTAGAQGQPVSADVSLAVSPIHWLDFGVEGDPNDDCFYVEMQQSGASAVAPTRGDLRLNACQGRQAMTLVGDMDTSERMFAQGPKNKIATVRLAWADVDSNNFRSQGDAYYLTTGASPNLPGTGADAITIRLTPTAGYAAGTLALSGDPDIVNFGSAALSPTGSVAWSDDNSNEILDDGDTVFIWFEPPGTPSGQSISDAFVLRGTNQPATGPVTAADALPASPIHRLDFGVSGDPADDCFYAEMQAYGASAVAPSIGDIRLTPCQGRVAFSLVEDSASAERSYPVGAGNTAPVVRVAWADADSNGVRTDDDYVYLTTAAAPDLAASGGPSFTIRISGTPQYAAGTLVLAGDTDLVAYGSVAPTETGAFAWSDDDANGHLSSGDVRYLLLNQAAGYPAGYPIPEAIVLAPGTYAPPPPAPGTTAAASVPLSPIHRLDFGNVNDVSDDCFYAEMQSHTAPPVAPSRGDVRLVDCWGRAAFSLVGDEDVAERSYATGPGNTAPGVRLAYADVNSNGRNDAGDWYYLTTGPEPSLHSSSSNTITLRLTAAGGYAAGTRAHSGQSDMLNFRQSAPTVSGSFAWTDDDANGILSADDSVYVLVGVPAGYSAGSVVPGDAIRLESATGPDSAPPPGTGTGTSAPTGSGTSTGTGTSSGTSHGTGAPASPVGSPIGTPVPERQDVHVEPRSVSFDAVSGQVGHEVHIYGRVKNPAAHQVEVVVALEVREGEALDLQYSTRQRVEIPGDTDHVLLVNWTPAKLGQHSVHAWLEASEATPAGDLVSLGPDGGDATVFWVGDPPTGRPLLLLSSGLVNVGKVEQSTARTIPVDVTAYNMRAENVRIDVFTASGVHVQSLTPRTNIEVGSTVPFYLQLSAAALPENQTHASGKIVLRAISDDVSSNVETLDVVVHDEAPLGIPTLGSGAVAVGVATAGALAAFFRRRP